MNHIAYLIPTLDRIAGAEQQVILLAQGMARRGWKVSVIALSGTGCDAADRLKASGVNFLSLRMRKGLSDPRGWLRLHQWIMHNQPDVLHAHLPHAALLARWSRLFAPLRLVVDTLHSPATGGVARRLGYRVSAGFSNATTAVSRTVGETWLASGVLHQDHLVTIGNGVNINHLHRDESLRNERRRDLGLADEFLWLAIGRLEAVKDHATLLQAFAKLSLPARLVVVGAGSLKSELQFLVKELGLGERVHFPGFQANVLPWLSAADGFVQCSRWEGLPMALLEASACELPCVITNIPGALEAVPNAQCRFVVPVGNADALAEAMRTVMHEPETDRRSLGHLGRQAVVEYFDLNIVLNQWEDFLLLLLDQHPQATRFGTPASAARRTLQLQ